MEHFRGDVDPHYVLMGALQGGETFEQVIAEAVLNAHPAIKRAGRREGEIRLRGDEQQFRDLMCDSIAAAGGVVPDPWSTEISCVDNGTGMTYGEVTGRLGRLGRPTNDLGQRSFFGRGIRDVWLAAGAGYLLTIADGVVTEAVFYRSTASPFAFSVLRSGAANAQDRASLGFPEGTRVAVPFRRAIRRDAGYVVRTLAQLRPVFEDGSCRVLLKLPGTKWRRISFEPLTEDTERSPLAEEEVQLDASRTAQIVVRRAIEPVGRWTPLYGRGALLVRSRWAAHELTLGSKPVGEGGAHLFGEVRCDALDEIPHESRLAGRPELVVRVDRRGLNRDHWLVARLYEAIDRIVGDVVLAEEARSRRRIAAAAPRHRPARSRWSCASERSDRSRVSRRARSRSISPVRRNEPPTGARAT